MVATAFGVVFRQKKIRQKVLQLGHKKTPPRRFLGGFSTHFLAFLEEFLNVEMQLPGHKNGPKNCSKSQDRARMINELAEPRGLGCL